MLGFVVIKSGKEEHWGAQMGCADGWMHSDGPGNFARFIRFFELEENGSVLRDVDENGADSFADLVQDIRRISGGIDAVTQVELRTQMNAQFLFVRPQLKFVGVPARLDWPIVILWPDKLKSFSRIDLDNAVFPAKGCLQVTGQDRVW